jgi:hypothetical protein
MSLLFQQIKGLPPTGTEIKETTLTLQLGAAAYRHPDSGDELFPVHSPQLGESSLVSFPLLNDMLKFSR